MTRAAAPPARPAGRRRRAPLVVGGKPVAPGTTEEILLKISEFYTANPVNIPVTVIRGEEPGPVVFLVAAVHGDELNGVEIVRQVSLGLSHDRIRGSVICVPVVNRFGFLNRSRYLPDRRDLNRCFPGSPSGSAASRVAATVFREIVLASQFGVDFHTAAAGRSNVPHLRADMGDRRARRLARWFGAELIIDASGRSKSLRAAAAEAGVPSIVYEAGETSKFQRREIRKGLFGVYNVLAGLGMLDIPRREPRFQIIVKRAEWIRAERGGILDLRARPGDLLYRGDTVGVITNPFGREVVTVQTHVTGVVLGTTTLPMVNPGDATVHIAVLDRTLPVAERYARGDGRGRPRIAMEF